MLTIQNMFGRKKGPEKTFGQLLQESGSSQEIRPGANAEATPERSASQVAAERKAAIKNKAGGFLKRIGDFGKRFADFALTADVHAKHGAKAAKESMVGAAKFASEKTKEIHNAGKERLTVTVEKGRSWVDQKSQALDNRVDSGMKLYEETKAAMKDRWQEMKRSALEERRQQLQQELAAVEAQLGGSNA